MCHFWSSVSALGWRGLSGGGRAPYIHTHTRRDTAHPTENVLRCWSAWALLGAARIGFYILSTSRFPHGNVQLSAMRALSQAYRIY